VRKSFRFAALSAVLTGSLAAIANAQTGSPQQKPIPPSLIKDCTAHIEKEDPRTKIVGPFAPARFNNAFYKWADNLGIVVIAAPARFLTVKTWAGCIYDPENKVNPKDGGLVLRRVIGIPDFPARTKLEPGEAP
jgi:hypothetical protein